MRGQPGFFDVDERLKRLSDLGDHLEAFQSAVDFEMFRVDLVAALGYSDGAQGGRPPFDPVMMFKILVIAAMDNLSDERTEFLITTVCRSCASLDCPCPTVFRMRVRSGCSARS
jgi:transposase, IS5 family